MDYTTIAAGIELARNEIAEQVEALLKRDNALEQSLTWAAIAFGVEVDADGEPITVESEVTVEFVENVGHVTVVGHVEQPKVERRPRKDESADYWREVFEWVRQEKADGTYSLRDLTDTHGTKAKNWRAECAKRGMVLDAAPFDEQAAPRVSAGPSGGPVKPFTTGRPAATTAAPHDAGYLSVGQIVAAAGEL